MDVKNFLMHTGRMKNDSLVWCVGLRRACDSSKYVDQRGAKSAKRSLDNLLALLALPHIGISPHARRAKCGADLGGGSASLMPRVCAKSPFTPCGAGSKEAQLYTHLRYVVLSDVAWLRPRAGMAASGFWVIRDPAYGNTSAIKSIEP
jgi:hypothetical protein